MIQHFTSFIHYISFQIPSRKAESFKTLFYPFSKTLQMVKPFVLIGEFSDEDIFKYEEGPGPPSKIKVEKMMRL